MTVDVMLHEGTGGNDLHVLLAGVVERPLDEHLAVSLALERRRYLGVHEVQDITMKRVSQHRRSRLAADLELPGRGVVRDVQSFVAHELPSIQVENDECPRRWPR